MSAPPPHAHEIGAYEAPQPDTHSHTHAGSTQGSRRPELIA